MSSLSSLRSIRSLQLQIESIKKGTFIQNIKNGCYFHSRWRFEPREDPFRERERVDDGLDQVGGEQVSEAKARVSCLLNIVVDVYAAAAVRARLDCITKPSDIRHDVTKIRKLIFGF